MRIIFQNGEVADLNNVDSIFINNEGEESILDTAIWNFHKKEGVYGEHECVGHQTSSDGSVPESNMGREGQQNAGQSGICDLEKILRAEEYIDRGREAIERALAVLSSD